MWLLKQWETNSTYTVPEISTQEITAYFTEIIQVASKLRFAVFTTSWSQTGSTAGATRLEL